MKLISLRKGYFAVLILIVVMVATVTGLFMVNLYQIYTRMVFSESAEILNLYSNIANTRLAAIEHLSFEVLSNHDIHQNLQSYIRASDPFQAHQAVNDLYTQLCTRWIMTEGVESISFVFLDGKRVDVGRTQAVHVSDSALPSIVTAAHSLEGSPAWAANAAGENTITLYRLIRDITGSNKFQPLGTLVINISADYFLNYTPVISAKYKPMIVCIADDQVLYGQDWSIDSEEFLQAVNGHNRHKRVKLNGQSFYMLTTEFGRNGWKLIYLLSASEMLKDIQSANVTYGLTLALITAGVAVLVYCLANAVNRPIMRLTSAMQVVEGGNYSVRLEEPGSRLGVGVTEVVQLTNGFSRMVKEIDRLINEVYAKQLALIDMKYRMLTQQINPHFLYNTLDTVNWKAIQSGNEEISVMVTALSKLLRSSIKGSDIISLGEELNFIADYIKIQKLRFEERLHIAINIPENLHSCPIPRLTLQPIVENSIIHNLEKYAKPCTVMIEAEAAQGELMIRIMDDGRGLDLDYLEKVLNHEIETDSCGIGLRNIDQRIKITFGEAYGIRVANRQPTGAIITVVLPCEGECDDQTADC
jgi:two-component system sensor histidine kinase YesM